MKLIPTEIRDVIVIEPDVFSDERGFFMETWRRSWLADAGITAEFVQDNHSRSEMGTLRGLHYQHPHPQGKLVRVTLGEVFDVAVDLRRSSPTFGQWVGHALSASNRRMLWIPAGFAHGFLVISPVAEFQYKCTDYYHAASSRSLRWDDPALAIGWPLPGGRPPRLSAADTEAASLTDAETYA